MTWWDDFFSTGLRAVAALGGVAVVAGVVAKFVTDHASQRWLQAHKGELDTTLESHKAELAKETETHKLTLKRQELLFQREVDAADAFLRMWRVVWPKNHSPDMDWHDACSDVAHELVQYEKVLGDFLEQHAVALSDYVREKVEAALSEATSEKFFTVEMGEDPPEEAVKAAERMLDLLKEAQEQVLKDLRR